MSDYVSAYALLGSDWQSSTSYAKFREGYTYTSDVTLEKISSKRTAEDELEVSGIIAAEERKDGEYITSRYNVTYQVGYENGQMKILHGQGKKIR